VFEQASQSVHLQEELLLAPTEVEALVPAQEDLSVPHQDLWVFGLARPFHHRMQEKKRHPQNHHNLAQGDFVRCLRRYCRDLECHL
jgi:hypothetical protein